MDRNGLRQDWLPIRHLTAHLSNEQETHDLVVWKPLSFLKSREEERPPTDVSVAFEFFRCDTLGMARIRHFYLSLPARADIMQLQQATVTGQLLEFAERNVEVEPDIAEIRG